jgi:glycosyltransferase involved in cell wall biosynthesis
MSNKPLRVCLISREFPPDTGWGGIATFAKHLAYGLRDIGHDVTVVSLASGENKVVEQDGITIYRVKEHTFKGDLHMLSLCMPYSGYVVRTSTALWSKCSELHAQKPFDVVDTPELLAEGLYPAVSKTMPLLIRLYTPHSKFIAEKLHNVTPSFDHQFVATLERIAMLNADVITSPSDDLADFVSNDLNYPRSEIAIVRNPIDPVEFSPDGDVAISSEDEQVILFVGRLEERKGIHYLIDAMGDVVKACPKARLVVIGDDTNNAGGQLSVKAQLLEKIAKTGIEKHITFIQRIPLVELPAHYRSAHVSVVPSVYDNSPYTCLEAMSCGRAVIGTSGGGTREYIVHGESGIIVPPRDTQALADALIHLLTNEPERTRLAHNARVRVMQNFQRTEVARQTAQLYQLAIANYKQREQIRLYRKEPSQLLPDAEVLMASYERMVFDLLYQMSWRFRFRHWFSMAKARPRLFLAKTFAFVADKALALTGKSWDRRVEILSGLREQIREKERAR